MYPRTLDGLAACLAAGVPFYRNDLVSTGLFLAIAFGVPVLVRRTVALVASRCLRLPLQSAPRAMPHTFEELNQSSQGRLGPGDIEVGLGSAERWSPRPFNGWGSISRKERDEPNSTACEPERIRLLCCPESSRDVVESAHPCEVVDGY